MILSLTTALQSLGYEDGWAGNDVDGIILWIRDDPQPTKEELVKAGWLQVTPTDLQEDSVSPAEALAEETQA